MFGLRVYLWRVVGWDTDYTDETRIYKDFLRLRRILKKIDP